jgi:hypothetical protein
MQFVLKETLTLTDEVLATGQAIPQSLKAAHAEAGEVIRPDIVIRNPEGVADAGKPRMLVQVYPADQQLEKHVQGRRWHASPADRMAELLKQTKCPLGLVTNGEQWILANKIDELPTGFASFYSSLWLEEPITLRAFRSLLGTSRFFGALPGQTLEEMLVESSTHQQEVTDQLGLQVRRAVEVLIQSLDRADQDHGRKLLGNISEPVLYESALTVMMRLVFLFCAEERELLLLGDPLYDQHYAVSTLVAQLQETADNHGEEILERRFDAWCRLLSTFRAVYGGVEHERMKLPAYAGNLFDPDRFPFLEGRLPKTSWQEMPANPLPVDNRTVLHLLRSLQYLQTHGEAQRVSFRALGIEQIGHVYEGLLDHTAKRAAEPMLGLTGAKGKDPEVALSDLEKQKAKGNEELLEFLKEQSGRSASALKNALGAEVDGDLAAKLRGACGNDHALYESVVPFAAVIRNDSFDRPVVIRQGSVFVTAGTDRRSSGTHYTPTSLTEPIVKHTLDPLCYVGPADGKPEDEWQLRSAKELLDLKICDMACGSGAFLVQACRYLSELLVEAWEQAAEKVGGGKPVKDLRITPYGELSEGAPSDQLIPLDTEERLTYARRLVAQRCLYGVDINPLAVEMAKLSLWLLTLAKDKPFTFLDHCIRPGDSLVGISNIEQLLRFSLDERVKTGELLEQQRQQIDNRLNAVKMLRRQIEELPSNTPQDIERKTAMLQNAEEQTRRLTYAADLLLATSWQPMSSTERETALNSTLVEVEYKFKDLPVEQLDADAKKRLQKAGVGGRFHWPLEFPEVFVDRHGFHALVGNPPFMGGKIISTSLGPHYAVWLRSSYVDAQNTADLCSYFFQRAFDLLNSDGCCGLLATNSLSQGDTAEAALHVPQSQGGTIFRAITSFRWPGTANVFASQGFISRMAIQPPCWLDGRPVTAISHRLQSEDSSGDPQPLLLQPAPAFVGSFVRGDGFIITNSDASDILRREPNHSDVLFSYLNGEDLYSNPQCAARRSIINFFDWSEATAQRYSAAYSHVDTHVKPFRSTVKEKAARERWWQYAGTKVELYETIAAFENVLVRARVSDTHAIVVVPAKQVFSDQIVVVGTDSFGILSVLQSAFHECWIRKYGSTLKGDLRYSPTTCYDTFPFPPIQDTLDALGERLSKHRALCLKSHACGMTSLYQGFHDLDEASPDIRKLRELHVQADQAVAAAYGWDDLDLGHGFHTIKQGERFTISEGARRDVLQRLLSLNHERYAEEVKQGLHDKKGKKKPQRDKPAPLFDE